MAKILVIEDDADLAEMVQDCLVLEHHTVDIVTDGSEALVRVKDYSYDLLVLDWDLPGVSGLDVLRSIRAGGRQQPVLMLTGKTDIAHKELGLDYGADDYLTKPFHPRELSARIRSLIRRPAVIQAIDNICAGDLILDVKAFKAMKSDRLLSLQPREFALLEFFMRHPNETFSAEALMDRVWSSESETSPDVVRVMIAKLRAKIDSPDRPSYIQTVHRVGYKFETPGQGGESKG